MKTWKVFVFTFVVTTLGQNVLAFEIDLSRRRKDVSQQETQAPNRQDNPKNFLDFFSPSDPKQEFVILNTEKGFVPSKVSLRKGVRYVINVVNVNEREKNVSFILDAFSEHHSTYYGKIKTFEIKPAQEGVFTFQCPETSSEGKFVVFTGETTTPGRGLSSEEPQ